MISIQMWRDLWVLEVNRGPKFGGPRGRKTLPLNKFPDGGIHHSDRRNACLDLLVALTSDTFVNLSEEDEAGGEREILL